MFRISPTATLLTLASGLLMAADPASAVDALPLIPVPITLDKAGYITAVVEDADGRRVCNLVSELKANAGKMSFNWDYYDVGVQPGSEKVMIGETEVERLKPYRRFLVKPGTYKVRGLVHDGITTAYEQSVYSPGTPPWKTVDMSGTWMGDHAAPADVLYLEKGPNGKPTLVLATACAESGHALSYTDLTGKKYKGVNSDNFNGATAVTIDRKTGADSSKIYFLNGAGLCTLGENDRHVTIYKPTAKKAGPVLDEYGYGDLAVYGGLAVISNSDNRNNIDTTTGNLLVVDIATKAEVCNLVTGVSRGVAFSADGTLYALIDDALVAYTWDAAKKTLVAGAKVVTGLVQPMRVRLAPDGAFYVTEFGDRHQVQVFEKSGAKRLTIGKPGGPQIGTYDEQRMDRPYGLAVTPQGEVWLAEQSTMPKRISIWDAKTGAFKRAIYGGPQYGGGGTIDPQDKTIFYYPHLASPVDRGLMVFKIDWITGESKLTEIAMRTPKCGRRLAQKWEGTDPDAPEEKERVFMPYDVIFNNRISTPPHLAIHTAGHRYVFNRGYRADQPFYTTIWRYDAGKDAIAVPVAMIGMTGDMFRPPDNQGIFDKSADKEAIFAAREAAGAHGFVWSDTNGDHLATASEIQFYTIPGEQLNYGGLAGSYINDDLSFAAWHLNGGMVPAPVIDAAGIPRWDLSKVTPLGVRDLTYLNHQGFTPTLGSDFFVGGAMGWDYFSNPQGYDRTTGKLKWLYRYYNIWDAPQFPGQMVAGMGSLGRMVKPKLGEAGEIWSTASEKGACYLMTADGLFLKTMGGDVRTTPLWRYPEAKRGMLVDGVTFEDECFNITINQGSDGEIYLVTGKEHISLLHLQGLQTVKRKDWGSLTITADMLKGLPEYIDEPATSQVRKFLSVAMGGTAPTVDGMLDDWKALPAASIAQIDPRTTASLWVNDNRIYGAYRTGNPNLLDNSANDPRFLFKFGGAIDLFFGAKWNPGCLYENNPYKEGDCRVLIAKVMGKPTAVLYRPLAPAAGMDEACIFESPIGKEIFGSVTDITSSMQFAEDGTGNFEFSLDMSKVLRHSFPNEGNYGPATMDTVGRQDWHYPPTNPHDYSILGDVGIIRGNGVQNVYRACWNNKDTWMTSDIPTEVRWRSLNFGVLDFVPAAATSTVSAAPGGVNGAGDLNGDKVVNLSDLILVRTNFGKRSTDAGWDARADTNGDNVVNLQDLISVRSNFGKTYP